ncbi:MAG: type II toxin-antitoxin system RelE/ParE family toxin [Verrucomicrobiota bacterium]
MYQIIFSDASNAELRDLPKELQLEILSEFDVLPEDLGQLDPNRYGRLERDGRTLYRYRAKDYRLYFEAGEQGILIHRVLHKNTLGDFLFRSSLSLSEDEKLQERPEFWRMIDGQDEPGTAGPKG